MNNSNWLGWRFENGLWREERSVSMADRGFRYGMSLFETVAIRNGKALFLEPHLSRLFSSSQKVDWSIPESWRQDIACFFLSEKWSDGVVRIFITAGEGSPLDAPTGFNLYVMWEGVPFPDQNAIARGIKVSLVKSKGLPFAGLKTGNYWSPVQTLQEARKGGADEALIFDADDSLISAAMANVFVYLNDKWITPSLASGARDGVVRDWILRRSDAVERNVRLDEIKAVEEIILMNSRIGIMPVSAVDGVVISERSRSLHLAEEYLNTVINA